MNNQSESGAALTETVVMLTVLIPLALGVSMIGKMMDVKQTTVQASRYAVWESTVHDAMPTDMDVRFFGDISNPIVSDPADDAAFAPNALWGEIDDTEDDPSTTTTTTTTTSTDGAVSSAIPPDLYWIDSKVVVDATAASAHETSAYTADAHGANAHNGVAKEIGEFVGFLGIAANATGGDWNEGSNGMEMDGLVRAEVSAGIQGNGWVDPMMFTQGTVILNDNWSASDAEQARDRVRSLVPAGALSGVGKFMGLMGEVPGIKELKYFKHDDGRGVFGYVDMEPLPLSETQEPRPLKDYEEED